MSNDVTEVDLKKSFEDFGQVESTKVITDMYTGRSKGFGFVEMPKSGDANSAIVGMDGKELKGRTLKVKKARPRSGARPGGAKRINPRYY